MKPVFAAPRSALERKPPHGKPCTRCGLCCMATLCSLGKHVFRAPAIPGPCPALIRNDDGSYDCGLVRCAVSPELRDAALMIIGSGLGCDARFNGEPADPAFYAELERKDIEVAPSLKAAWKLWR